MVTCVSNSRLISLPDHFIQLVPGRLSEAQKLLLSDPYLSPPARSESSTPPETSNSVGFGSLLGQRIATSGQPTKFVQLDKQTVNKAGNASMTPAEAQATFIGRSRRVRYVEPLRGGVARTEPAAADLDDGSLHLHLRDTSSEASEEAWPSVGSGDADAGTRRLGKGRAAEGLVRTVLSGGLDPFGRTRGQPVFPGAKLVWTRSQTNQIASKQHRQDEDEAFVQVEVQDKASKAFEAHFTCMS
ncbi:unnamed protein product [Protopolystoma xenopodis]|uniref:Uncharacterized protein n=1 Tax=Protopolystoma xenopodis TaxID=117903 RepID=A0A448XFV5_9PLAT|nr:unnamed protein product [Protopolystoma xenopodis]